MNELQQRLGEAIAAYKAENDEFEALKAEMSPRIAARKARVQALMEEYIAATGDTKFECDAGKVKQITRRGSVKYDHKALDNICETMPEHRTWLAALRSETAGSTYITIE